jgi:hypothetical protein
LAILSTLCSGPSELIKIPISFILLTTQSVFSANGCKCSATTQEIVQANFKAIKKMLSAGQKVKRPELIKCFDLQPFVLINTAISLWWCEDGRILVILSIKISQFYSTES